MTSENANMLETIADLVQQFAIVRTDGRIDSGGLSALADAMRILQSAGLLSITHDKDRHVIAKWNNR